MKFAPLAAASLVTVALALGCDEKSSVPATPPSAGATNDKATDAAAAVRTNAAAAQDKLGGMMNGAADKVGDAAATAPAADASNPIVAQAQKLYDEGSMALAAAKFDDAQKYVDQLKALRDKLPADWQTRVDQLVKAVGDAKAKMGNLPSMPSMPSMPK